MRAIEGPLSELSVYPVWFLVFFAFVFGALVGSFLNVVIARVPRGQSIVWPPSHCMSCGKGIPAHLNVPIFSYWLLKGRCANCKARFSVRYSLVELGFAVVCAYAVWRHGLTLPAWREMVLMGLLIPLAMIDLDTWLLPHALTWPGIAAGLAFSFAEGRSVLLWHLLAAAVAFAAMQLVGYIGERILGKEALGQGDAWLLALIGAFLGLRSLLPVVLLSSVQGSLVGFALIAARRRTERNKPAEPETAPQPPAEVAPAPEPTAPAGSPPEAEQEEEEWVPDPTAIPFGPFLALAAAEILYFTYLPEVLFPIGKLFN